MTANQPREKHIRLTVFWTVLGALATLAVLPYSLELNPDLLAQTPLPLPALALLQVLQSGIMLLIGSYVGLRLGASIGLDSPIARAIVYRRPRPRLSPRTIAAAIATGCASGLVVIGLDLLFQPHLPPFTSGQAPNIARWKGLLASFYGAITEELLVRLFLMTLIAWLAWKLSTRGRDAPSKAVVWVAIALAAVLFGAGHLPAASLVWPLTPTVVLRIVVLNAIPGVAFGYLYWKQGLEHAMLAHFCADLVLHVIAGG